MAYPAKAVANRTPLNPSFRLLALVGATLCCAVLAQTQGGPDVVVMAPILLASVLSSIAGFAFSAICGAALFHVLPDRVQVVQIMMVCSIANQAAMTWALRRNIEWRTLAVSLGGGMLGLPLGVWMLLRADRLVFSHFFGAFLLAYGLYNLLGKKPALRSRHHAIDGLAGFIGGITGGAVGFPSAAVTICCGLKRWDKVRQRAVVQPFILAMQIAALLAITLWQRRGAHSISFSLGALLCVPAALLGTHLGMACFKKLSNQQFSLAVNLLLLFSGASFLI